MWSDQSEIRNTSGMQPQVLINLSRQINKLVEANKLDDEREGRWQAFSVIFIQKKNEKKV